MGNRFSALNSNSREEEELDQPEQRVPGPTRNRRNMNNRRRTDTLSNLLNENLTPTQLNTLNNLQHRRSARLQNQRNLLSRNQNTVETMDVDSNSEIETRQPETGLLNSLLQSAMSAITTAASEHPVNEESRNVTANTFMNTFLTHLRNGSPNTPPFPQLTSISSTQIETTEQPNAPGEAVAEVEVSRRDAEDSVFRAFRYITTSESNSQLPEGSEQVPVLIIGIRSVGAENTVNNNEHRRSWIVYVIGSNYPTNHPLLTNGIPPNATYEELLALMNFLGPQKPPVTTLKKILEHLPEYINIEQGDCSVCLDSYEKESCRKLNCDHIYHKDCIDKWLTTGGNSCPLCRTIAVPDTLHEQISS